MDQAIHQSPAARPTAAELQPMLVDLVALSLLAKQAHWNVRGPLFQPLHAQFDALADALRGYYDDVAERMLALGVAADGRPSTVASSSRVEDLPSGPIADREAVTLVVKRLEGVAARLRGRIDVLGDHDPVTQDLIIGVVEGLEKQAWMLRVQQA
jgi:starvation-inducible DNA-binding protein